MELFELIQTLNTAHGPSGDEGAVREVIAALARPHADEVTADTMGNLIVRKRGSGPKVMLCAHMDSTGLIVTHIEKEGFLRVGTLGGIAARELLLHPWCASKTECGGHRPGGEGRIRQAEAGRLLCGHRGEGRGAGPQDGPGWRHRGL
ncbi:MAG: hypothetical protein ACLT3D_12675 [Lawsonibacter sp.]